LTCGRGIEAGMEKLSDEELLNLYSSPDVRPVCQKVLDWSSCITELFKKTHVRKLQSLSFMLVCPLGKYWKNTRIWAVMLLYCSHIIFIIISSYMPLLQAITDLLLKGVQFPYYCAKAMMEGQALF
jgi:hypothetical protein